MNNWDEIKYFKQQEFDSPDQVGTGINMNFEFVKILDKIRKQCGFAFTINSGFRTPAHNATVGGKSESAHTDGLAVDIAVQDSRQRFLIIKYALENGIKRVGVAKTFVHLDYSIGLPQEVAWLY